MHEHDTLQTTSLFADATDMLPRIMKPISEEWQEIWDCCADNKLRAIKPTVGGYKRKTSLSRHDCVLINRLRIGHIRLTHSYLLLGDDQPECGTYLSVSAYSEAHHDRVC